MEGSASFANIETRPFWLQDDTLLHETFRDFNFTSPTLNSDESAYQEHFVTELVKLQRKVNKNLRVVDTSSKEYLSGRSPDVSFFYNKDPVTAFYVAFIGEIKPLQSTGRFTSSAIGQALTYAEKVLEAQPFRSEVTVFLTDCTIIQFFNVIRVIITSSYSVIN